MTFNVGVTEHDPHGLGMTPGSPKDWTYWAEALDDAGNIIDETHGLKRTKLRAWIKERS